MKIKRLLVLSMAAALLGGCGNAQGGGTSTDSGDTNTTSQIQPGNPFTFESGQYVSDVATNLIVKFDSVTKKLGIDVYDSFAALVKEAPNASASSSDVSYTFAYVERCDMLAVYDSSAMCFTYTYDSVAIDCMIFYSKTEDGQKGDMFMANVIKSGDSKTYHINPFVKYSESKIYSLAKNALKPGGDTNVYQSNEKVNLAKPGIAANAYVQIKFNASMTCFEIFYSEDGSFVGEQLKEYVKLSIKNFRASFASDEQAFIPSKVKMHTWNEEAKSYKFAITTSGGQWSMDEVTLVQQA